MKPVKYFLVFGICVAVVVVLAQTALGGSRAAAKPVSSVSSVEPMRHSAKASSPLRSRVQATALGRVGTTGSTAARHSAKASAPASFRASLASPAKVSAKAKFRPMLPVAKVRPGVG